MMFAHGIHYFTGDAVLVDDDTAIAIGKGNDDLRRKPPVHICGTDVKLLGKYQRFTSLKAFVRETRYSREQVSGTHPPMDGANLKSTVFRRWRDILYFPLMYTYFTVSAFSVTSLM